MSFFFSSRFNHEYFLKIVNNYFRKTWIISFCKRFNVIKTFLEWKLIMKLQSEIRLQTIRNDNIIELKFVLND